MTVTASESVGDGKTPRGRSKNPFMSIKFFVFCHGLLQLCQYLVSGYLRSSISTIEKRFGLSSQMSGQLASFNEVGNVALIVVVSYFGSRVHRPRVIGCGGLLVGIAGIIMSLPHFMVGPYEYDQSIASVHSNHTDICQLDGDRRNHSASNCASQTGQGNTNVLTFLFIGQFLLGVGGVPIQPFGISYIDDFASKRNSPLYIGILYAVSFIGPGGAFLMGSAMLRYYVDIDKISAVDVVLTPTDPRWLGAWWLGFLVTASVVGLAALPYFFFPREMQKEEPDKEPECPPTNNLIDEYKPNTAVFKALSLKEFLKLFPKVLLRNLKNPVLLLVILAKINLTAVIAGTSIFIAKYLEQQFSITASKANFILGSTQTPSMITGLIVGGAIMKRFRPSLKQCASMCTAAVALCIAFSVPLLFLGCPTQAFFGPRYIPPGSEEIGHTISECNSKCNCPDTAYNPICGSDGIEYISPCYAGCEVVNLDFDESKILNYTQCTCIPSPGREGSARPGSCGSGCSHLVWPFLVISSVAAFVASTKHSPALIIILRSVQPEDKALALGIQYMLLRILGWIFGPILYGRIIDSTCLLWERKCENKALCRYYDNTIFRQRYLGLHMIFQFGAFLCFLGVFYVLRRQQSALANKPSPETQTLTINLEEEQDTKA